MEAKKQTTTRFTREELWQMYFAIRNCLERHIEQFNDPANRTEKKFLKLSIEAEGSAYQKIKNRLKLKDSFSKIDEFFPGYYEKIGE